MRQGMSKCASADVKSTTNPSTTMRQLQEHLLVSPSFSPLFKNMFTTDAHEATSNICIDLPPVSTSINTARHLIDAHEQVHLASAQQMYMSRFQIFAIIRRLPSPRYGSSTNNQTSKVECQSLIRTGKICQHCPWAFGPNGSFFCTYVPVKASQVVPGVPAHGIDPRLNRRL
eukprot:jgi/Botrbrau1/15679/Bobra.4_1s0058.1